MIRWNNVEIGSFLKERTGKYKPTDTSIRNLPRLTKIDFDGNIHLSDKDTKTNMIKIEPGDLVISGINVSKGAIAVYDGKVPITATIHYSSYQFDKSQINIEFFKRFLKSPNFVQALQNQVKGGIKTEIKSKHLLPLKINIPDLDGQEEILHKFFDVEKELNQLDYEIESQGLLLDKLRKNILQDAVEGKLTKEWRNNMLLNIEDKSAINLLKKISDKKVILINSGRVKKEKPLPPVSEKEKYCELPDGWIWCKLGLIIEDLPRNGYSPREVNYETPIKSLKLGATTKGFFNHNEFKYIADSIPEDSPFWLENGDILIQRGNSREYVGVSAVYYGERKKFIYPDLMMKIRAVEPINVSWLHNVLLSPVIREYFRSKARGSQKTMPKIKQDIVTNAVLPLPPVVEQQAIVDRLDQLMLIASDLEKQISERRDQAEYLMQSILKEAFESESIS